MRRILIAFFLAPLAVSPFFGILAIAVYPFMLVVTLCVALPLFALLRWLRWLEWWHALLAGALCGASFVAVNTALGYAPNIDRLINSNNVFYVSLGAVVGVLFWWIGVFRNQALPFVSRTFPVSFLLFVPAATLVVFAHQATEPSFHQGRVIEVLVEPTESRDGLASVRLSTGGAIEASLGSTWPKSMVVGHCFHVEQRWSTLRLHRVYELAGPFGGDVNEC